MDQNKPLRLQLPRVFQQFTGCVAVGLGTLLSLGPRSASLLVPRALRPAERELPPRLVQSAWSVIRCWA